MKRLLLISCLFSMATQAMEPLIIKDINGAQLELTEEQRNALGQCETFKNMFADCGSQTIDFEGIPAPVIKEDLEQLASLLESYYNFSRSDACPMVLSQGLCRIPQEKKMGLFKLADYLNAPEMLQVKLADHIYNSLLDQIKATQDEDIKADLEVFKEIVESKLSYYPDCHALAKDKAVIKRMIGVETREAGVVVQRNSLPAIFLGNVEMKKRIRSLNGIEAFAESEWAKQIKSFWVNHHEIREFDLVQLKKAFPMLAVLNLEYNKIQNIHVQKNESNLKIDARNNRIQSVTIDNPRSLKNVKIIMDKNKTPKITVNQSLRDKLSAWFTALGAQSKVALARLASDGKHKRNLVGAAASLSGVIAGNVNEFFRLTSKGYSAEFVKKRLIAVNTQLGAIGPWILVPLTTGLLWEMVDAFKLKPLIQRDLAALADADKHIQIDYVQPYDGHMREVSYYNYPSKYEYNLFGKN